MMQNSSLFSSCAGFCSALALLFALFSCNKSSDLSGLDGDGVLTTGQSSEQKVIRYERIGVGVDGQPQSSAQAVAADGTKVTFNETSGSFSWQGTDFIRVQRSVSAAVDVAIETSGSAASVEVPLYGTETRAGFAYYPASIQPNTAVSAVGSTSLELPDTYSDYAYPYAPTPMLAVQTVGSNLNFQHLGGLMLLTVNVDSDVTSSVTKIKVTFDKRICGDFTATVSGGYYQIATDSSSDNKSITYNLATPVAPGGSQKIFVPLPVGTYTVRYVSGYDADGALVSVTTTASASRTLARKGGRKVSVTMTKATSIEHYTPYELVYGKGNCIIDDGTDDDRNVTFDATPYLADDDYLYTNTPAEMSPLYKEDPVSAKVLWYEGLSKAPSASLSPNYQVTVSGISGTGNCVVGLYNANEIVWSFHIWSPGWNPTTTDTRNYNGYTVMGASLGAMNAYPDADHATLANACGMYYQWGRKDPLGRSSGSGTLTTMTAVQSGIVPAAGTTIAVNDAAIGTANSVADHIAYSIKNPHMFITYNTGSNAWFSNATYTATNDKWDNKLWGTLYDGTYTEKGKTIFDPCPAGWKVATTGQVFANCTTTKTNKKGHTVTQVSSTPITPTDFIAYSGYRDNSTGAVGNVANTGYYWSSCQYTSTSNNGEYMLASTSLLPKSGYGRAYGYPVRCVRLQN